MSVHSITLEGTSSVRLPVGGKYCDRDIVISTVGGPVLPALTTPGAAEDLLEGKQLIDGDGNVVEGAMPIQDTDAVSLTPTNYSYTIPAGYHPGGKKVTARRGGKTVTPTKTQQTVSSTSMFLNTVTVDPIPDRYQDVTSVTATAEDVAEGKVFVDATGAVVTGTASSDSGEFYTIVNKYGYELCVNGHSIAVGETYKLPIDVSRISAYYPSLVTYSTAASASYINAIVNVSGKSVTRKTTMASKFGIYWGTTAYPVYVAMIDIRSATNGVPPSGSTIILSRL